MKRVRRQIMLGLKKIEDMTEIEAARLAMLIDTDGCIHAAPRADYYVPEVTVEMASLLPVEIVELWGGLIYEIPPKEGEKRRFSLQFQRRFLRPILRKIRSFLKIKREQADIALLMLDALDAKSEGWKENLRRLAEEMSRLNDRQPPHIDLATLKGAVKKRSAKE